MARTGQYKENEFSKQAIDKKLKEYRKPIAESQRNLGEIKQFV